MTIVVTKRISLEFLGDEYKEGYIVLKSIPLKEYESLQKDLSSIGEKGTEAVAYIKKFIAGRFIEGKIPQGAEMVDLTTDNLEELPAEVFLEAMATLSGKTSPN